MDNSEYLTTERHWFSVTECNEKWLKWTTDKQFILLCSCIVTTGQTVYSAMQLDCEHWTALYCVFHKHLSFHTETVTKTKTKIMPEVGTK